jgi:hypothetical protein
VNKWHFALQYADFAQIYNKTLLTEGADIDLFIEDKTLLQTARSLEAEIKSYIKQRR